MTGPAGGGETALVLVGVLGPLQIGGQPAALAPRDRVVLSALALGRGSTSAPDVLAEALWGDSPPSTWPKVLQGAIVRLRRSLGREAIESVAGGYRLAIGESDLDAAAFAALVTRARALAASGDPARALVTFDDALGLWRGMPYTDLLDWSQGHSESLRLEELRQSAQEERVETGLACGRAVELVAFAQQLVAEEPQRERRWQLLASALYGAGRQTEALEVLRRASTALREELGLDPGPDLADLEQAVLRHDPTLPRSSRVPRASPRCPYPGLLPFDESDADSFAGRESDIAACVRRLGEQPLLVVAGASGCGKSSLVRAGVVPALRRSGRDVVLLPPGPQGAARLAALRETTPLGVGLVVDQLEEMTATGDGHQEVVALLDRIAAWATDGPVVVVVRTDRLDDLGASPALAALAARGVHLVTVMQEADLRRAIERPAESAGLLLESSLVDVLLRDVGQEPGSLPHLSHALRATWEQRERDVLTVAAYSGTGGIRGAVAQTAEDVYARLDEPERLALRGLLLRLVVTPPGGLLVAARLPHGHLSGRRDVVGILDRLVATRLLTVDEGGVALAHASLATSWPRLREWIAEDAAGLQLMAHLQTSADGWAASGRPDSELYRGDRLHRTLVWTQLRRPVLGLIEREFLDRAQVFARTEGERTADEVRTRARVRRRRLLTAGVAAAVLVGATVLVTTLTRSSPPQPPALVAADEDALLVSHRDSTGLTNLFVIRPDGSGERPLMPSRVVPGTHVQNGSGRPTAPRWSSRPCSRRRGRAPRPRPGSWTQTAVTRIVSGGARPLRAGRWPSPPGRRTGSGSRWFGRTSTPTARAAAPTWRSWTWRREPAPSYWRSGTPVT